LSVCGTRIVLWERNRGMGAGPMRNKISTKPDLEKLGKRKQELGLKASELGQLVP